jgi:hypothetical protein
MNTLIISFVLGIGIIIFCVLSLIFPYGQSFREKTQKIQGFGLNLEVSVLTLLLIIGFVFIFFGSGIWFQLRSIDTRLKSLETEKASADVRVRDLQERLDRQSPMDLVAFIKLKSQNSPPPNVNAVDVVYETATGGGGPVDVSVAPASGAFKIAIRDFTRDTTVTNLIVKTKDGKRKWKLEGSWMPLLPTYELIEELDQ